MRPKLTVGQTVEVRCDFLRDGARVHDWLAGQVVQADYRMVAVKFETDVFSRNGWRIPDRVLWCAHGSPSLRVVVNTETGR
jgi:hypothetical protein